MINSIIDLDFYKLTMGQFAFYNYPDIKVKYEFFNRKLEYRLADYIDIDVLKEEFWKISELQLKDDEFSFLKKHDFKDKYLSFLQNINLSIPTIEIVDGNFKIYIEGYWCEMILWETFILSTINELYYKFKYQDHSKLVEYGTRQNLTKYEFLSNNERIQFMDFSTRRRYCFSWQKDVVKLMSSLPNFLGTSNAKIAMDLNLKPLGTNAHELYMISSGIHRHKGDLPNSVNNILDEWYEFYDGKYDVALTDTFGTKSFLEDFGHERFKKFSATRQDSGSPYEYGVNFINKYKELGIDPMTKYITFSDSLNIKNMSDIEKYFNNKINVNFGWGTNLGNDMGVETLSIVVKATEVTEIDGEEVSYKLVKLSDNLNKHMGEEEDINIYKETFRYDNIDRQEIKS